MEEIKKKNRKKIIILSCIAILLVIGITYAHFRLTRKSEQISINSAKKISVNFESSETVSLTDAIPLKESEILTDASKTAFTITNNGNDSLYARIDLKDLSLSTSFKDYDIKWALYQGDTKVTTGNFAQILDGSDTINMANNISLAIGDSVSYTVYVWINETPLDQNDLQGGTLTGKVAVTAEKAKSNTLVSNILGENNANVLSGEYNFDTDFTYNSDDGMYSTNYTAGLYTQTGDSETSNYGFPTYYYRGAVTNNYVELGTYKADVTNNVYDYDSGEASSTTVANSGDAILWRIVRINEDGSIKLISENSIGSTTTYVSSDTTYTTSEAYKYINSDGTDSALKSTLDTWYSTHITESNIDSIIQYGDYCNTHGFDLRTKYTDYVTESNPSFVCPNTDTSFMVNEKVGTITADELVYSGILFMVTPYEHEDFSYLINYTNFWTMTGMNIGTPIAYSFEEGLMWYGSKNDTHDARAVITIKGDTLITGGSGLKGDPYIIKID